MRNPVSDNGTARGSGRWLLATVSKALDVLELFSDTTRDLSLTEIAELAELPKSSTFRYLATLKSREYLQRDPETERYQLGPKLMQLGAIAARRVDVQRIALPLMRELRETSGETVNLVIPGGNELVYLAVLPSPHPVKLAAEVGSRDYMHATALGKAMLASMSDTRLEELRTRPLPRLTEHTRTDWPSLLRELELVRRRGFAMDDCESDSQVRCVGAAILNHLGRPVGAISISGPSSRFSLAQALELGPKVLNAAQRVSMRLGYRVKHHGPV